jgi:hypothetical protein
MEDRRKILQKQLDASQTIPRAAYVEIVDKGVQRSIMEVALAYRGALAGLLHQYSKSGSKKRKQLDASL